MNNKLFIEIETNFDEVIEQAEELLAIADDMAELKKEETVFEAELGNGMSFKGTKSDFVTYVEGLKNFALFASKLNQ